MKLSELLEKCVMAINKGGDREVLGKTLLCAGCGDTHDGEVRFVDDKSGVFLSVTVDVSGVLEHLGDVVNQQKIAMDQTDALQ